LSANPRDAFGGQSESPNMVPFNMLGMVYTVSLYDAQFFFYTVNFKKCRDLENQVR